MTQTLTRETAPQKSEAGYFPLAIKFEPVIKMTDELFEQFCAMNDDMRIELSAEGTIEIMPPTKGDSGAKELDIAVDLGIWARADGSGIAFGSSAGFTLPNSAVRAPDASWIPRERLAALTEEEKNSFMPVCPDFVVELRSRSDRLSVLQAKMDEYMANGARLGWLLDPLQRRARIYRPQAQVEILDNPDAISADPELPGFTLDLKPIWDPAF